VELANGTYRDGLVEVVAIRVMSRAFQAADRQVGGGVLYGQVVRYLKIEIGPRLLDADGTSGLALFTAASSMTEIAGWMAHDCGQDRRARQHFDRAYRLALAAGNDASVGNVCASMSHLAGQLDQSADAVRIAEAGLVRAQAVPGTVHLVARLHAMHARGLAMRGDAAGCRAALHEAERTLDAARNEPPAEWPAEFDAGSLASEAALCLRQLGDLPEAERQAHRILELRPGDRVRSRALGQLTLARVLVDAGRVDEAATVGQEVCQAVPSLTSTRVLARLDRLGAALARYRQVPEVSAFFAALPAARRDDTPGPTAWPI
jgi:tetratricopeptide (TPR) repeat protein